MTAPAVRADNRVEPLVAAVCRAPLVAEAVAAAFAGTARVHAVSPDGGDLASLLRSVQPDAVVVDGDDAAAGAAELARESGAPVVHLSLVEPSLQTLVDGRWERRDGHDASPEGIRNLVLASILSRRRRR